MANGASTRGSRDVVLHFLAYLVALVFLLAVAAFLFSGRTGWAELTPDQQAWSAAGILVLVLLTPLIQFLVYGWDARRQDVLDLFPVRAILLYYRTYCVTSKKRFVEAKTRQFAALAPGGEPGLAEDLKREVRGDFVKHFDRRYGRRHFVLPIGLLILVAGTLAFLGARYLLAVRPTDDAMKHHPADFTVLLCLAGAYCWVLYDFVSRERSLDFSTTHVNWASFRLVISAPLAYAIPSIWTEARLAVAFLLGTFPTGLLMTLLRRRGFQLVGVPETPDDQQSKLESLPSINTATADRFREEGITTASQLASADPVALAVRTGFPFRFALDCVSEALAWYYLQWEGIQATRTFSLPGALDVFGLIEELDYDDRGKAPDDPNHQRALGDRWLAYEVIKAVAAKLGETPAVIERKFRCMWADSRVKFLAEMMDAIRSP